MRTRDIVARSLGEVTMNKLLAAVVLLGFATAHAQTKTEKPATPPTGAAAKPATPPSGAAGAPAAGAPAAGAPPAEMAPPKPGPETEALKPFAKSVQSTGTIVAGAMGPNSPETPTKGKSTCKWTMNNLWVMCEIDETSGTGKTAMKWMGHWVFGYDFGQKGYRAFMTDNWGTMTPFKGTLEGTKLTWESIGEMKGPPGMPTKMRVTLDATDPKAIKFTEEGFLNGKWMVRGTATHKVAGGGAAK
jgi:hypothetical protein